MMEIVEDGVASVSVPQKAAPVPSTGGGKYILVDISEQHMYVYEGDVLLYSFVASTGVNNATRVGTFAVQSKIPNAYGSTWDIWMPEWLGIYWAGGLENGIHALPICRTAPPYGKAIWACRFRMAVWCLAHMTRKSYITGRRSARRWKFNGPPEDDACRRGDSLFIVLS